MARLNYFNGNGGFWAVDEFEDYRVGALINNSRTLTFENDFDPTQYAHSVVFTYSGATTAQAERGEFAGQQITTGGTLTAITYFNEAGKKIAALTGLKVNAALFDMYIRKGNSFEAVQLAIAGGLTVTGSANSAIPQNDWDGDDITTGGGNDTVNAGAGDDYIKDRGGKDVYNGGTGFDMVDYDQSFWNPGRGNKGIDADLAKGTVKGFDGQTDKLTSIESLGGTYGNDKIKGSRATEEFIGYAGNDTIDGGLGLDWVSYRHDHRAERGGGNFGVIVDLKEGRARDGWGTTDTLRNISNVEGSEMNDTISGFVLSNHLRGRGGDDRLDGRGGRDTLVGDNGNDTITGGTGNDQMNGGFGSDVFVFANGTDGQDRIEDFVVGTDRLQITGLTEVQAVAAIELVNRDGEVLVDFNSGTATILLNNVEFGSVTKAELFSFG